jgi:hypothetical protein
MNLFFRVYPENKGYRLAGKISIQTFLDKNGQIPRSNYLENFGGTSMTRQSSAIGIGKNPVVGD